ncbi:MAG: HAD-IC family P-type ATPase [Candidatus Nealsonbacteria bacterium]|nr:HAD-IC family P-type ATPase [Candidatus Nealsonbacteria bacterium]
MAHTYWHALSWQEAIKKLDSNAENGLSQDEVLLRQKKIGKNTLPEERPLSGVMIFFGQLKSPLIYILLAAGTVALFFREWPDATVIFGAVLLNTAVGFFQERKASRALFALKKVVRIKADIIREGHEIEIDHQEIVPGDIVILSAGKKTPADARLIEARGLSVNEAPLTGEWLSAVKSTHALKEDTSLADRDNMVYMGTAIVEGKGRAVAVATGNKTEVGRIAVLVKETKEEKTPLQKKLANFSKVIGIVVVFMTGFIFLGGIAKGEPFLEMFMTSVAVAVAAIPEGLPVAMTVILTLGMQRILKRKGLVRKLVAAEILGSTSIIATDKTLTLTEGKMQVEKTFTWDAAIATNAKHGWEDVFKRNFNEEQNFLMKAAALCSQAFVENPEELYPFWRVRGGPTDSALLLAGAMVGIRKHELEIVYKKEDEIPFNAENKYVAALIGAKPASEITRETKISLIRDPILEEAERVLFVSGAPEKIIEISNGVLHGRGVEKMKPEMALRLQEQLEEMTSRGLRVVGVGYKEMRDEKYNRLEDEVNDLIFIGFIGLKDPLRPEAKEAIGLCRKAGMKPIIVTGDHLLTAKAIGEEIGLKTGAKNIINGPDIDGMTEKEFQERVKEIEIYSRVEPRHKLMIVGAWQKMGKVVAMTGDGINDAPALKKADIGIALGSGTDVAKEVSDLILLTDNFSIIVAAIEEGRAIIDNIRKVITYLLSDSFTETILVGASLLLGWPLPLTAVQILWINLIEDGLPGVALAFEPKEAGILERKPKDHNAHLLTKEMKVIIFFIGIATDILLLGLLWWLLNDSRELNHIRTIMFAALGIDSLFYIFSCKNLRKNIWQVNPFSNKFLVLSWLVGMTALAAAVYLPFLNVLLETVPLDFGEWIIILGLGVANILLIEAAKYYFIARHRTE